MLFAITATVSRTGARKSKGFPEGWESSRQVPTFFIDSRVQGALNVASAEQIARDVLQSAIGDDPSATISLTAVLADPPVSTGYICKECGGPSPVGVGYVSDTPQDTDVEACPCGYSRKATHPEVDLAEVFGDAIAYRTNSGEGADSDEDEEAAKRFTVATRLGVTPN